MKPLFVFLLLVTILPVSVAKLKKRQIGIDHCGVYDIDCSAECATTKDTFIYSHGPQDFIASETIQIAKRDFIEVQKLLNTFAVVGGQNAGRNTYPYMVALFNVTPMAVNPTEILCGASIIGSKTLLSAAHCFFPLNPEDKFIAVAGDYILNSSRDRLRPLRIEVANITIHPEYKETLSYNDIAILFLKSELTYSKSIKPVCLPSIQMINDTFDDEISVVTGWGRNAYRVGDFKATLQEAYIPVIPQEICQNIYSKLGTLVDLPNGVTQEILCAGEIYNIKKDACEGDSGGPLVTLAPDNVHWIQIGIVSVGIGCGGEFPGLYTRITQYLYWIQETVSKYKLYVPQEVITI